MGDKNPNKPKKKKKPVEKIAVQPTAGAEAFALKNAKKK